MKNVKIISTSIVFAIAFFMTSCRGTESVIEGENLVSPILKGEALLKINLLGDEYRTESFTPLASVKQRRDFSAEKEKVSNFIIGDQAFIASLRPVSSAAISRGLTSLSPAARSAATSVRSYLKPGVTYRIVVYKGEDYVTQKLYTINELGISIPTLGEKSTLDPIALDKDTVYTFVVYSFNNKLDPGAAPTSPRSQAVLNNINGDYDLMYYSRDQKMKAGENVLEVILKHKFSQITTIIDASAVASGAGIQSITSANMNKHRMNNSMRLSNGDVTFDSQTSRKAIDFSANTTSNPIWTSKPILLANPGTAAVDMEQLSIASMRVGNKVKNDILIPNLVVSPGVKYDFELKFACTEIITPAHDFLMEDTVGNTDGSSLYQSFVFPAADSGFTFEIYQLDNSINMKVNGVPLANQEIQFQRGIPDSPQNIRFKSDRGLWQSGGILAIYNMHKTNPKPSELFGIVKVIIGPDGLVSMFGRRSGTTPWEPLELFNGAEFNKITWRSDKSNDVQVSMKRTGYTYLRGRGEGRRVVPCP
ncbi:hypothetical protein GNY06_04625 [Elizabethkingia argentiflava]|uniref:Uncharacterized protein n=1 Tax=Elizabethkingia argenteiflava TaxID=2681556 RepID=A0A845PQX8_9FLAO|nr:hypothetical protein [Elizabethkingia argenteiflava]